MTVKRTDGKPNVGGQRAQLLRLEQERKQATVSKSKRPCGGCQGRDIRK